MFRDSLFIDSAIAIYQAKRENKTDWDNINAHFLARCSDRRYRVWFDSCTTQMRGFWRVGKYRFLLEFIGGNIYVRPVSDSDKYAEKPCYEIIPINGGGYRFEWQNRILI